RPEGKQRPPRKIGAPIGRATAFDQICRTSGRHDRRTGPFFGDKYYCASAPDEECERPLVRQGRLIRFRGYLGKVDLSHEQQRLRLLVSRPSRHTNSGRAAKPTARARPVDIDLTWATRNEKCR